MKLRTLFCQTYCKHNMNGTFEPEEFKTQTKFSSFLLIRGVLFVFDVNFAFSRVWFE